MTFIFVLIISRISRRAVAVGTAVADGPPHRSVLERLLIRLLPQVERESGWRDTDGEYEPTGDTAQTSPKTEPKSNGSVDYVAVVDATIGS